MVMVGWGGGIGWGGGWSIAGRRGDKVLCIFHFSDYVVFCLIKFMF